MDQRVRERFYRREISDYYFLHDLASKYSDFTPAHTPISPRNQSTRRKQTQREKQAYEYNKMEDKDISTFGQYNWANIRDLYIQLNNLGPIGCGYLSRAQMNGIQLLQLNNNKIQDEGCKFLSRASWNSLKQINLRGNQIADKGCQYLSKAKWNLQIIYLCWNKIGDRGCGHICRESWPEISEVSTRDCGIRELGWRSMAKSERNLKKLDCWDNIIGVAGFRFLRGTNKLLHCKSEYKKEDQ